MHTVVLTGVSRGLGAALFDQLAGRGDRILGVGRTFSDAQQALAAAEPERIRLRTCDLAALELPSDGDLAWALDGVGHAALIHNAATVEPIGAVGELASEPVAAAVALNLTAPMVLTNAFLAALPDATPGTVLFISSGAAKRVIDGWSVYCATKAGGEMFFDAVASQGRVRVANVNPGVMDTAMQAAIRGAAASEAYFPGRQRYVDLYERGELASPADVAAKIIEEHLTSG
ncbi:MAG: SDR family NAD(P)-dependent oxidoreductase [Micromonosporaceae bacterium]